MAGTPLWQGRILPTTPEDPDDIIWINPNCVQSLSPVAGSPKSRRSRMEEQGFTFDGGFLHGDWDLCCRPLTATNEDYEAYKAGKTDLKYDWFALEDSIKRNGYIPSVVRNVEVCFTRMGEISLVDGRHRLVLAQRMGIPLIPVVPVYVHTLYSFGNLKLIYSSRLPRFIHSLILSRFPTDIPVYQSWEEVKHRTTLTENALPILREQHVLEIGPNAGMMTWAIMEYAASYTGLEKSPQYFKQASVTLSCLQSKFSNALVWNSSIHQHELINETALYASFVLYHMSDAELTDLRDRVLPRMRVVIIPNRRKERKSEINTMKLNRPENIENFLRSAGFSNIATQLEQHYSVTVAQR